jgi:hypothetical protein
VEAKRESFPDLEMNPAPGFDPLMPHDLMHLIVEAVLGLKRGIFGQLTAGGDAGTFHTALDSKAQRRIAVRTRKRGRKLLQEGVTTVRWARRRRSFAGMSGARVPHQSTNKKLRRRWLNRHALFETL